MMAPLPKHPSDYGVFVGLLLGLGSLLLSPGCGKEHVDTNRDPSASLVSGPVQGDTVSYSIDISWSGTDPDGFVSRFEYAVDPPAAFTEEEIARGGPGIVSKEVPGAGENPAVTRVTKTSGGQAFFFDWIHTQEESHHFTFDTPEVRCDSIADSLLVCRFTGMHAVYLRAVDDDGATSLPEKVAFTASNVAPESRVTRPRISQGVLNVGNRVIFEWTGTDPDSPHPGKEPDHYLFRGVRLDTLDLGCPFIICEFKEALGPFSAWEALAPGVHTKEVSLEPGQYLFAVAAVDEHGGVEPFLDPGRNAVRIWSFATDGGDFPTLELSCGGETYSSSDADRFDLQWPVNTSFQCEVLCSAESYGEDCHEIRWGVDLLDPESDQGWSSWSADTVLPELRYETEGIHVLYVQGRDTLGNVTTLALILDVKIFLFDRDVLFVDDSFDSQFPTDAESDDFWRQLLTGYGIDPLYEFNCFGANDREHLSPQVPALEELGRYKLVVWVNFGSGYNGETALIKAASIEGYLGTYLTAGGRLWVLGRMTVPSMLESPNGIRANLTYPILDDRLYGGTFAWDYMKLRTTRINTPGSGPDPKDLLWGVAPYPGRPAVYDSMTVDQSKLRTPYQLAAPYCEAVFNPIYGKADPGFRGDLDSLYVYRAYGPEKQGQSSTYHGRLNAIRWHDPDPEPVHGRIQWFGFPLYFMKNAEAQETFNRSLDWFREGP